MNPSAGNVPVAPEGNGPLIWLRLAASEPADGSGLAAILQQALVAARHDLRCLITHPASDTLAPDPGLAAATFCAVARPAATLLVGDDLPEALLLVLARARVPAVIVDARFDGLPVPSLWHRNRRRAALEALSRVLVADHNALAAALRASVPPDRIERIGILAAMHEPPRCSDAERYAMTNALAGRQIWYAAGVPMVEEVAVFAAHRAALGYSHRALLLISPADPDHAPALAADAEAAGFSATLRSSSDEPGAGLQVLVADDPEEAGLWYRLAPVTYAGGTLSGDNRATPHPYDPASLGSAILRGPYVGAAMEEWTALGVAGAIRMVRDASGLAAGIEELLAPDRAADLATRAWRASSAPAAVAQRIAEIVLSLLPRG